MSNNRADEADRYATALDISLTDLARAIMLSPSPNTTDDRLDEAFFKARAEGDASYNTALMHIVSILTLTNRKLLLAVIDGTLPGRVSTDLKAAMEKERDKPSYLQGIYVNYVVGQQGNHPTKADILQILETMEEYKDAFDVAYANLAKDTREMLAAVDNQFRKKYTKGSLWYCGGNTQQGHHKNFVEGMYRRLSQEPDGPLAGGISEVGFSNDIPKRLTQHQQHTLSTPVMCLFNACARYHFPGRYSIMGYALMRIVNPLQASMAEAVFSRLACSYITFGWGFNITQAGISVNGVNSLPILRASESGNKRAWSAIEAGVDPKGQEDEIERVEAQVHGLREEMAARLDDECDALDAKIAAMEACVREADRIVSPEDKARIMAEMDAEWGPSVSPFCSYS